MRKRVRKSLEFSGEVDDQIYFGICGFYDIISGCLPSAARFLFPTNCFESWTRFTKEKRCVFHKHFRGTSVKGGWQCCRRAVSQLQNGQRAPDFLLADLGAHFRESHKEVSPTAVKGATKQTPPSYLQPDLETTGDMGICYILDGILIFYGIILTVLYCRLRMHSTTKPPAEKQPAEGGIYAGLYSPSNDTYETIRTDKKSIV